MSVGSPLSQTPYWTQKVIVVVLVTKSTGSTVYSLPRCHYLEKRQGTPSRFYRERVSLKGLTDVFV